jgi:hypothetical protein
MVGREVSVVTGAAIGLDETPLSGLPIELFDIGIPVKTVGDPDGVSQGAKDGQSDSTSVGLPEGSRDDQCAGAPDGASDGATDCRLKGTVVFDEAKGAVDGSTSRGLTKLLGAGLGSPSILTPP